MKQKENRSMKISVCGKGGSGKSTVTTLLAKQAILRDLKALVVDADDSNSGLYQMLGFASPPTPLMELVGGKAGIKEKMGQQSLMTQTLIHTEEIAPDFIRKQNGLMLVGIGKILQALEGCACPMGVLNREFLKKLSLKNGEIAIVDMEAGVEHFGRGIDENIDHVLVVVEPSFDSLNLAGRIKTLAAGMQKRVSAVLNKTPSDEVSRKMKAALAEKGLDIIGTFPSDPLVFEASMAGSVPASGVAFDTAGKVLEQLLAQ